jgi:hypothetical protein
MSFNYYVSPNTYHIFCEIVLSLNAHKNGCICLTFLTTLDLVNSFKNTEVESGEQFEFSAGMQFSHSV